MSDLRKEFSRLFPGDPAFFRAPGRANVIGEHTDYNEGLVLPAAVNFYCWAAAAPRTDSRFVVYSKNKNETAETDLRELEPGNAWSDYPFGVAWKFQQSGYALRGTDLYIDSEVPLGAGLSSSAAIEVASALALVYTSGLSIGRESIAILCQAAENEFVGTKCGIMDQFACCLGEPGSALFLDCRSLRHTPVPIPQEISLVICNTMIKHALVGGEYNRRREECEQGVKALQATLPEIRALRDVTPEQLESNRRLLPPTIYKRCRHVISENGRVDQMTRALRSADTATMSRLMTESHQSLREDFEVSTPELDRMVELAHGLDGFFGGRMMGGGFGGCTINLVRQAEATRFAKTIAASYESAIGLIPEVYICQPADGAERLAPDEGQLSDNRLRGQTNPS